MDKRLWLKVAAGLSFSMAACQAVIAVWPAAAAYFQAPPDLLNDRVRMFVIGGGAALIPALFGLYALSGANVIPRLPLLRTALVGIGSLFLLRGLFIILTVLTALGYLEGQVTLPGVASHLVFLSAGVVYLGGAIFNWKALKNRKPSKADSMQPTSILGAIVLVAVCPGPAAGEIHKHAGSPAALPHEKYVRVVSEADSPVQQAYVKSKDGAYVAAAIRKPKGDGPFPAIIMFHGAPGGRGMEQLVGWARGDHGGPVWERFLSEGFVVAVADYRGGDWNAMNVPSTGPGATAVDDGLAVIEHVTRLPYVDAARVSLYGVSLGGNLVAFLASKVPTIHAAVLGAPAPIWFLGMKRPEGGSRDLSNLKPDQAVAAANIAPIRTPLLILAGTADGLLPMATLLHDQLTQAGKTVQMDVYEHGYHDFVLGPQGQKRPDLPQGEALLQGTLDALELTVSFVKAPAASR